LKYADAKSGLWYSYLTAKYGYTLGRVSSIAYPSELRLRLRRREKAIRKVTSSGEVVIFVYDLEGQLLGEYDQTAQDRLTTGYATHKSRSDDLKSSRHRAFLGRTKRVSRKS